MMTETSRTFAKLVVYWGWGRGGVIREIMIQHEEGGRFILKITSVICRNRLFFKDSHFRHLG